VHEAVGARRHVDRGDAQLRERRAVKTSRASGSGVARMIAMFGQPTVNRPASAVLGS
jgi:hypothetical protein